MKDLPQADIAVVSGGLSRMQNKALWHGTSMLIPSSKLRPQDKGFTQPVPFPTFTR